MASGVIMPKRSGAESVQAEPVLIVVALDMPGQVQKAPGDSSKKATTVRKKGTSGPQNEGRLGSYVGRIGVTTGGTSITEQQTPSLAPGHPFCSRSQC